MKIAIYQIAMERDENRLAFQSLNHIISVSNGRVPAELYDCVFAGEASAQTLEDIFYVFNMEHPSGYKGRSLSVSDVVEIFLASGGSEFYYPRYERRYLAGCGCSSAGNLPISCFACIHL